MPNPPENPLNEPTFFILLSLSSGPKHGYAVLKDVDELSAGQVTLSTSTLYTALNRLEEQGFIDRSDAGPNGSSPGLPRKVYALNERGRRILSAEAHRLQRLLAAFQRRAGEAGA